MKNNNKLGAYVTKWLNLMDTTPRFGWYVGVAIFLISLYPKFFHYISADSAEYLYLAGRILDGDHYYHDFFEYNTPFALIIYCIPVLAARLLEISIPVAGKIFSCLLIFSSIVASDAIIRRSREWSNAQRYNALLIALFYSASFISVTNELTTKTIAYVSFVLPYFFSLFLLIEKTTLPLASRIIISCLLGYSVGLKPTYVLFPLVTEAYLAYKRRSFKSLFRWENLLAAGVTLLCYVVILPIFFPDYLTLVTYFSEFYDGAFFGATDRLEVLITILIYCLPALLWFGLLSSYLKRFATYELFWIALFAEVLISNMETVLSVDQRSLLEFFITIPFLYSILLVSRNLHIISESISFKRKLSVTIVLMMGTVSILRVIDILDYMEPKDFPHTQVTKQMVEYVQTYAPHEPVYSISDNTQHWPALTFYIAKRPYQVFPQHRMFFNIEWQKYHARYDGEKISESTQRADAYFMHTIKDFFIKHRPKLVFVNTTNVGHNVYCLPDLLELLKANDPEFNTIWGNHYKKIGTIKGLYYGALFEDRESPRRVELDIGGKSHIVEFPPMQMVAAWLDVYLRKEE